MRALQLTQPGRLRIIEIAAPVRQPNDVMLRIHRVGICGTDMHAFRGNQPFFTYPRILGHEIAATVEDPGNSRFAAGDWVSVIPYRYCGRCLACRNNRTNCCSTMRVFGVHTDGGMAELFSVPENLLFAAPGLPPKALAILEPLAIGTHAVRRACLSAGETVVVIGLGPIGIGVAAAALQSGARVIATEMSEERRAWVSRHLNNVIVVPGSQHDLPSIIRDQTDGDFAATVFEATGNLEALEGTLALLGHGGTIVLVGLQSQPFQFLHPDFHRRETTLMSSRNATAEDFTTAAEILSKHRFPVDAYVGSEISFDRMPEAMPEICRPESNTGVIKHQLVFT